MQLSNSVPLVWNGDFSHIVGHVSLNDDMVQVFLSEAMNDKLVRMMEDNSLVGLSLSHIESKPLIKEK